MNTHRFQPFLPRARNRKPQWTHKETQHLIREFDKKKQVLRPKLGEVVSSAIKHRAWVEISQAVNLTNPHVHRTVSEVQKKWQNLCLSMKKTKNKISESGSDDNVERKDVENMILEQSQSFLGEEVAGDDGVMTIKIESVDSFDSNGSYNYVDDHENRPDSTRVGTSYSDVEFTGTVQQTDFSVYQNRSNIPETENHVIMEHHGIKRQNEYNNSFGQFIDADFTELKKQKLTAELQTYRIQCEKLEMEKEKLQMEKEKLSLEKEKLALELQHLRTANQQIQLAQHKTHSQLEKERMALENEKLAIEVRKMKSIAQACTEKAQLEKAKLKLENDKLGLELQNLRKTSGHKENELQPYINLTT